MKTIDLHTHTTFSDGTYTPRRLAEYAAQKGLSAVAVTDHDTFGGIDEAEYYGRKAGVEIVPGIEISTDYNSAELHIVGLYADRNNKELNTVLAETSQKRISRNKLVVEKLNDLGVDIKYSDVEDAAKGGIITRAHFARALLNKGYIKSISEAFDRYIGDGKPAYIRRQLIDVHDAIELINGAGGIAVLAHPLLYGFGQRQLESTVKELAKTGLTGIEAYYSTHTPSDTKNIKMLAQKYGLKISGGSDFHGENKPKIDLGTGFGRLMVPYSVLVDLRKSVV